MLIRSRPRISRTGFTSQISKHTYTHLHHHAYSTPTQLNRALTSGSGSGSGSLPLSYHSFPMLHSSSSSSSSSASTFTSISISTFPFLASRCFPVRSFSTQGPGGRRAGPGPEHETEGEEKPKTPEAEQEAEENPYGDGFKEKFGLKRGWKKAKKIIKWGLVIMFTYYAITDHPNVEGEKWYITVLLKPYRTIMAMYPPDDSILIPAETPDQFGRRTRTLVVNWEQVLVASEWGRSDGWSVRKRPGLDEFLARAYKAGWEIVVFCNATQEPTEQHILRADPTGGQIIRHRIFYEGTSFYEGFIVKDLNRLGRDLERIVAVDYDTDMYRLQRSNLLKIKRFNSDKDDKELEKIAQFLENLSRYNVHDVRPYIAKFNANPADPTMFAEEEQARIQAAERLRKAKRSRKYSAADTTTTTTTPKTSTTQAEKEEQGWFGWVKGITGVFSRS